MKALLISSLLCYCLGVSTLAQSLPDSLQFIEHVLTMKKKSAVLRHLGLSEAEKSSFWPVFDSYQRATKVYEMQSILLISKYQESGDRYSPKELYEFSTRLLKNDLELAKVRKKYYRRFRQAVSPDRASAFMQLDERFRNTLRMRFQKELAVEGPDLYTRN